MKLINEKDYSEAIDYVSERTKRLFKNKKETYSFLEENVFKKKGFIEDIKDVALELDLPFNVIYNEVTIYLTDVFYEVDKAHILKRKQLKINIYTYISLIAGIRSSFRAKHRPFTFYSKIMKYLERNRIIIKTIDKNND